ncbi:pentatricopeptide repeat domain-containing protein (PPR motif) [Formivibrio citricus]|uniref:Pentatricopeptide repeat domain-containing protein (PPR motif) n=1 Tax=Formivibrio citricus TaxID=83765 RepID=A0A1I4Y7J5_9NEIS|nr:response regulator [Formivibrio citricus]SFN33987.1 pentatricopeptide repeat domain-containing protein (PPR motif) [Formivibrio citricus]
MAADLSQARVLVADDAPTVRQSVRLTLAQAGITRVDVANSIGETRRRVRDGGYDVVLCDYHFGEGMNGQELLEELRRSGELSLSTIWFMITAEAAYEKVVSVAEVGPDDYLIKPFTSAMLADRLYVAWQRKSFLRPVLDKINAGDIDGAIDAGMSALPNAGSYRFDLLRLLSNLLLQAGRLDEAKTMFEEILGNKIVPWAKLGLAKVLARQGNQSQAESMLQSAIVSHAQYVDAYEELAALYMEAGRVDEAMGVLDKCLTISPNNVARLQKAGNLANMMGDAGKARQLLERAVVCGGNSSALSPETLLQLALAARRDNAMGDADKYLRMAQEQAKRNDSLINRAVGKMASAIYQGKTEPLAEIEPWFTHPEFTQEAAVGFIMTADMVCPPSLLQEEANPANPPYKWLGMIARRFITTKHISGMLETATGQRHAWKDFIQQQGQEVTEINKQGVQLMLKNREAEAVALLLPQAEKTHNNRLMLSASHASLKYMKIGKIESSEQRHLIESVSEFIVLLRGMVDESVLLNLRKELDGFIKKKK